jgi:hypothetical protein
MDRIHKIVGLPGDYFNKYHELVVESICKKDDNNIRLAIESDWISLSDLNLVSKILVVNKKL